MKDIPQIYIILLERDSERSKHVKELVKNQLVNAKIFSAIDCKNQKYKEKLVEYNINISPTFSKMCLSGQICCMLSHYTLWKKMVDENIQELIILEDDALPCSDFYKKLKKCRQELPHNYNFFNMYTSKFNLKN